MTECTRQPNSTWTRCRCPRCVKGINRVRRAYEAGLLPPTQSEEAWAVLDDLVARGWNQSAIASASGLKTSSIHHLLVDDRNGHRTRMTRPTAHAIINHGDPTKGHVGAYGATRRLQALTAMGYQQETLAAETGLAHMTVNVLRRGAVQRTSWDKHQAVAAAFTRLAMKPGPSWQSRRFAAEQGWVVPLMWDDIDDPDARPVNDKAADDSDPLAVDLAIEGNLRGPLTRADRHLAITELARRGLNDTEISARVRVTPETVLRDRQHLGIPAIGINQWSAA